MKVYDGVVVGAGVVGSAAARALALAGRDVLALERFAVGHTNGSSHGSARIWRMSYADPRYVRMMQEALPVWRALEEESGETLLTTTGAYSIGGDLDGLAASFSAGGADFEWRDHDAARADGLMLPPGRALFDPVAGVVLADRTWRALVASARKHGAEVREGVAATALRDTGDGVAVATSEGEVRARVAIVTAGSWAAGLLGGAGIELPVRATRETVSYYRLPAPVPVLIDWSDPLIYALYAPEGLLKAGEHIAGPTADPDSPGAPDRDSAARIAAWVSERYAGAEPEPVHAETCMYTNTADEHFVLERRGNVVVGSACSGHGFKFAPLTGARLAGLATG